MIVKRWFESKGRTGDEEKVLRKDENRDAER